MSILVGLGYLLIVGFITLIILVIRASNRADKRRKIFDEIDKYLSSNWNNKQK